MISPRIKKNTQSETVKHKSRRNDDGGEEEEAEEEKYVEVLSFICKNVQMYWHSDESALRTQIRSTHTATQLNTMPSKCKHTRYHMSGVQFRFSIIRFVVLFSSF